MHGLALLEELQHRTPKKSGLLASSWRTNINAPSEELPTEVFYETEAMFNSKMQPLEVGDSIHLTNNQPYARRIEYGHGERNPPSGFARPALRTYRRRLRKK